METIGVSLDLCLRAPSSKGKTFYEALSISSRKPYTELGVKLKKKMNENGALRNEKKKKTKLYYVIK